MARRRLEYEHRGTRKRQHSFKGRDREPLFLAGEERDDYWERVANPDPPRGNSPKPNRKDKLRPVQHEYDINFDQDAIVEAGGVPGQAVGGLGGIGGLNRAESALS